MTKDIQKSSLFKNKKGFLIRDVLLSLIVGVTIIALFIAVFQTVAVNYHKTSLIDPNFESNYNKFSDLTTMTNNGYTAATGTGSTSFLGQFDVVFNSFFSIVGMGYASYNIMFNGVTSIVGGEFTFLPQTIVKLALISLLTLLLVYIIFSVISATTRGRI